ncbi:hypothetical protein HAX54_043784, partial [Datura stramonium]|nr:hypothetical protein [Datura stramonium]
ADKEKLTEVKDVDGTDTSGTKEEQIFKDANLSSRVMKAVKTTRKGKKQDKSEAILPVRI